jgi:tetratricopeptide (TPR) repeat protein
MGKMMAMLGLWLLLAGIAAPAHGQVTPEQIADHQRAAQQAEARDDFETAIHEYELLARWLPKSAEAESNLGVAFYFHRDFAKAAEASRRAMALNGDLYAPHLFLGLALARLSQPDEAATELKKAVAINKSDPLAHLWLGYEYIAQARYQDAVEQLEIAAAQQPGNADIWFALGQSDLELGKAATKQLLESAPDSGRVWQLAAEQLEVQGNSGKAVKLYLGALSRRPDLESLRAKIIALGGTLPEPGPRPAKAIGQEDALYARVQQYEQKAKDAFERVSQIDPDSYRSHQILADSYAAGDKYEDAIREDRIVLQRNHDLPGIHEALCDALSRIGQIQEAVQECEAEIRVSPYNSEIYVQTARIYLLAHDDARAATLLKKALALDRPPLAMYKMLGKVYLAQKQYDEAAKAFRKYVAVETKDSSAYYLLARACKYAGDTQGMEQAIAAYKRTAEFAKNTSDA